MVVPDSEKKRLEFVEHHLKTVKKCDKSDLRRVYEQDYAQVMGLQQPDAQNQHQHQNRGRNQSAHNTFRNGSQGFSGMYGSQPHYSQKRTGGMIGNNKKYRRF